MKDDEREKERGKTEGEQGRVEVAWGQQVRMAARPPPHPPAPIPALSTLPGYLSVSGPSSVLSRGAGGSRLAGPCGGGSPSSGEASPVAGGEQGWLGGPLTETPLWGSVSSAVE